MEQRAQGWLGAECEVIHSPGSSCVFFCRQGMEYLALLQLFMGHGVSRDCWKQSY